MPPATKKRPRITKPPADVAAVIGQLTNGQSYRLANFCARVGETEDHVLDWFSRGLKHCDLDGVIWVRADDFFEWLGSL